VPAVREGSARSTARCTAASSAEGSAPSSSASVRLASSKTASASAGRPPAASTRISSARSRSRSGCAATSACSSATIPPCPPTASCASARSSMAARRSSSNRATCAWAAGVPLEAVRVHVLGLDREPVTHRMELDQAAAGIAIVAQPAAQPGHLGLQRVGGIARRVLAVQAIDQPVSADHPARLQQQQGQAATGAAAHQPPPAPVGRPHLHRTQDAKPHGTNYRAAPPATKSPPTVIYEGCVIVKARSGPGRGRA
jgi:hypothetical protein